MFLNFSEPCNELFTALAKAQSEMESAKIDARANAGKYSYSYATLASVISVIRLPLTKNNISFIQLPKVDKGSVHLTTLLTHSSGQYISHVLTLPISKPDAQGIGGIITYARRYSLMAILGISGDEDDDANEALGKPAKTEPKKKKQQQPQPPPKKQPAPTGDKASPQQVKYYHLLLRQRYGIADSKAKGEGFKKHYGVTSANDFTKKQISTLIENMKKHIEENGEYSEKSTAVKLGSGESPFGDEPRNR